MVGANASMVVGANASMVLGAQASMVIAARANFTLGPHTENHVTGPTLEQRVTSLENTVTTLKQVDLAIARTMTHVEQKTDWIVISSFTLLS